METLEFFQAELDAILAEHGPATIRYCRPQQQRVEQALDAYAVGLQGRPDWWRRRCRRALRQALLNLRQALWVERGPTLQANLNRVLWAAGQLDSGELGWNAFQAICSEEADWLYVLTYLNGLPGQAREFYAELLSDVRQLSGNHSTLGHLFNFQRRWSDRHWTEASLDRQYVRLLDGWYEQAEEVLQLHARMGVAEEVEESWQRLQVLLGDDPAPQDEGLLSLFELCWQMAEQGDLKRLDQRLKQLGDLWWLYCHRQACAPVPLKPVLQSSHLRDLHGLGQCLLDGVASPQLVLDSIEVQRQRHRSARDRLRGSLELEHGLQFAEDALILLEHFVHTLERRYLDGALRGFSRCETALTRLLEAA